MKKLLLFTFALFLWTGAWAQTKLEPTNVVQVGETPVLDEGCLAALHDGITSGENNLTNGNLPLTIYYDLGEAKSVGSVIMFWTRCTASAYSIYVTNVLPTSDNSGDWGDAVASETSYTFEDNTVKEKDYNFSEKNGRYVIFQFTSKNSWAASYGIKLNEIEIYEPYTQILTSIASSNYIYPTHMYVPTSVLDQYGKDYHGATTWSMPGCTGFKPTGEGFYFSDLSAEGIYTLTVSSTGNPSQTNSKKFALVRTVPNTSIIPAIDTNNSFVIFSGELNIDANDKQPGWQAPSSESFNTMSGALRIHNFGSFALRKNDLGTDASEVQSIVFDVYALDNHNIKVNIDNSNLAAPLSSSVVPGWNHLVIPVNTTIATGLAPNSVVKIYLDEANASTEDMLIYNVYFSKVAPVTPSKSVTFIKPDGWNSVYVWAWKGTPNEEGYENFTGGTWPGEAADNDQGTYTWTTTGDPEKIIFSDNGSNETATFAFVDGATYDSNGIPAKRGYYIVGTMNDWTLGDEYKMTKNDVQTEYNEYMFEQLTLTSTDEFKVCYSADGVIKGDHFPTNNITGNDGPYNVYFCPEGERGGDWIDGHVYMQETYNVVVEGNNATVTGVINAGNLDAIKAAVGMSTYVDVSGATLETYFSTGNPNALYLYATNKEAEVATKTPNPVHYDGARFYYAPKGVTLVDAPASYSFPENAFSGISPEHMVTINRSIEGNKYVTSFMGRDASPGFPMVATLASGLEAYELTAAEAGQLTFTKVTGNLETNKGYVIHNTTSDPLTLTWDSHQNDRIYLDQSSNQNPNDVTAVDDVKIVGTMHTITTDGNQWILSGGEIKKANGAKITAYRAYFTGVTLPASGKASAVFVDGETTKIGSINANGEINVENGAVYNLAGQRVAHPTKGLYIVNGKKVIIK